MPFFCSQKMEVSMKVIGYVRVSSDKQDAQKQEHLLLVKILRQAKH